MIFGTRGTNHRRLEFFRLDTSKVRISMSFFRLTTTSIRLGRLKNNLRLVPRDLRRCSVHAKTNPSHPPAIPPPLPRSLPPTPLDVYHAIALSGLYSKRE